MPAVEAGRAAAGAGRAACLDPERARGSRRQVRVLHVIDSLEAGGAERVLVSVVRGLDRTFRHSVLTLYGAGPLASLLPSSVPVRLCAGDDPASLASWARSFRPDIVHSWMDDAAIRCAVLAAAAGIPHVHRIPNIPSEQYRRHPRSAAHLNRVALALQQATGVSALSAHAARDAESFFRIRRPTVIYNGFPLARIDPGAPGAAVSRPSGRLVALAVGRLSLEKAHDVLIDAVDLVRRRGLDLDCWIAGIGPREAPLRDAVARLGLNAHVRLLGYVESIEALLNAADVFVLPSLSEGFCNALVEAMRARRPVVASDLPVIRDEIVRDSGAAVLCEPGSATSLAEGLMTLAGDGPLRACMGLAGGHAAEVFSRDAMLDGTRRLYELAVRLDHDHAAA